MRKTLRRSCDACAKSKLSCDLQTPTCSRCIKKKTACVYVNEPLTATQALGTERINPERRTGTYEIELAIGVTTTETPSLFDTAIAHAFDPFDSHPPTRLPRTHVQRLIHHFLSNIAFQYYPLDLEASSNPFVVSWWPLALADPALFHVSLQTASLDIDLHEGKGFAVSELLMADSVSLIRQNIDDPQFACQDETLDCVVTLAAIEFGKGNLMVSSMHIDGVKRMIELRGGIRHVKTTSPLTARMVAWVSLILMQTSQFLTESDHIDGLPAIAPWHDYQQSVPCSVPPFLAGLDVSPSIFDILNRLRHIFMVEDPAALSTTDFHDMTCFTLHKLLDTPGTSTPPTSPISEAIRLSLALFMLAIHGPTYFSHAHLQQNLVTQLLLHVEPIIDELRASHRPIVLWITMVGMACASMIQDHSQFSTQARLAITRAELSSWDEVLSTLKEVLWFHKPVAIELFRRQWQAISSLS